MQKIVIQNELNNNVRNVSIYQDEPEVLPTCNEFTKFKTLTAQEVFCLISTVSKKSCDLDPISTTLLLQCTNVILPVLTNIINLSFEQGKCPASWKEARVYPRLKKADHDNSFSNLRPISNLAYISKLTERAAFNQLHEHLTLHNLYPTYQSSYQKKNSTETALLKVFNDILLNTIFS